MIAFGVRTECHNQSGSIVIEGPALEINLV